MLWHFSPNPNLAAPANLVQVSDVSPVSSASSFPSLVSANTVPHGTGKMASALAQTLGIRFNPEKQESLLKLIVLSISAVLGETDVLVFFLKNLSLDCIVSSAFSIRLFSVLRYESMIHEFDPYFNYRTTKYLTEEGFYSFHNWFDDRAWYPLGR